MGFSFLLYICSIASGVVGHFEVHIVASGVFVFFGFPRVGVDYSHDAGDLPIVDFIRGHFVPTVVATLGGIFGGIVILACAPTAAVA
jgi:hypothetical protein